MNAPPRSADFPSADAAEADVLEIPQVLNLPVWLALLRLRPLRDFWERDLRRGVE